MSNEPEVSCKWCGTATTMVGTRMCDACWELERRINADPEIARRMLRAANDAMAAQSAKEWAEEQERQA